MESSRFSVDAGASPESKSMGREVLSAVADPSWAIAFLIHVVIILILAFWFWPIEHSKVIFLEQSEAAQLMELEPLSLDFEVPEPSLQAPPPMESIDIDWDNLEPVDMEFVPPPSMDGNDAASTSPVNTLVDNIAGTSGDIDGKISAIQKRVTDAGGDAGEVQFSLSWNSKTDLDLHLITPRGERIYYRERNSRCKGELDVDCNAKKKMLTTTPVENIRWIKDPLPGRYTAFVHAYRLREGRDSKTTFELMAKTGDSIGLQTGEIPGYSQVPVFRYVYFSPAMDAETRARKMESWKKLQEEEEATASEQLSEIKYGSDDEETRLWRIFEQFPHTDAAIAALKRITGRGGK